MTVSGLRHSSGSVLPALPAQLLLFCRPRTLLVPLCRVLAVRRFSGTNLALGRGCVALRLMTPTQLFADPRLVSWFKTSGEDLWGLVYA